MFKLFRKISVLMLACVVCLTAMTPAHATASPPYLKIMFGDGSFALNTPAYVLARVLAASTAETFTVPTYQNSSGATKYASTVFFSSNCDFYANYTTTATVPADTTDGTASELNPTIRALGGTVTAISVITAASACIITANFYK